MSIEDYCLRKGLHRRRARELDAEKQELLDKRKELLVKLGYSATGCQQQKVIMSMCVPLYWCLPEHGFGWGWQSAVHHIIYKDIIELSSLSDDDDRYYQVRTNDGQRFTTTTFADFLVRYDIPSIKHTVLRTYFALCRIQRAVRRWLEQPTYSNGHDGFHARKSWEEACRFRATHDN